MLLISFFKTEGNFIEYICKVFFEHTIFTEPVPVLNAACADSIVAPVNSFCPPYTTTRPLLYLWPKVFFHGNLFHDKSFSGTRDPARPARSGPGRSGQVRPGRSGRLRTAQVSDFPVISSAARNQQRPAGGRPRLPLAEPGCSATPKPN